MGRLTKKVKSNVPRIVLEALGIEDVPTECVEIIKADGNVCSEVCRQYKCRDCPINKAFEKLAHYEDLEEQGRLVIQRYGRWIKDGDSILCSVCGNSWNVYDNDTETFDYCPECGAKLKELEGDKE